MKILIFFALSSLLLVTSCTIPSAEKFRKRNIFTYPLNDKVVLKKHFLIKKPYVGTFFGYVKLMPNLYIDSLLQNEISKNDGDGICNLSIRDVSETRDWIYNTISYITVGAGTFFLTSQYSPKFEPGTFYALSALFIAPVTSTIYISGDVYKNLSNTSNFYKYYN